MPKYDYKCDACNTIFEAEHSMSDSWSDDDCLSEACSTGKLRKVFNPSATHFKGQGWGKTYRVHKGKKNDG